MNRLVRILLILLAAILAVGVILAVAGIIIARRPLPRTAGTLSLPGLQDEVHVYRDEFGIPHIYATSMEDLFMAQGYIHSQDRFWQMEFWRHISQGRISEIAGAATLDSDKFIRTMGWNRLAQNTVDYYKSEEPEYYDLLLAYSAGVNAYIQEQGNNISINRTILTAVNEPWEIEPWEPVHTVGWGVVMSDDLSRDMFRELAYADLIDAFGEDTVFALMPPYDYANRPVIAATSEMEQVQAKLGLDTAVNWQNVNTHLVGAPPQVLGSRDFVGSNNWVISGEHTDTGMPLLANDPHLAIQMPAIWYEIGLHAPGYDVVGFSFAGVPGVIIGHNEHIAWGVTNAGADVQDLYIEKINPDNPNQYEFMGEWRDITTIEETIKVNGGEDVVLPVRLTQHGPIMSDVVDGTQDVLALRWTAAEPSRVLQSVVLINQAQNYEEFRDALRFWDIPSQNFVYADTEGNIAYQMPGLVPIRQNGSGNVPVPGWTGEYEWTGWIPFEELPAVLNPDKGYIATANHAIVDPAYPYFLARDWADGDRGQRIVEMIEAAIANGSTIDKTEIGQIQFDSMSLLARSYVPLLQNVQSDDGRIQEALTILQNWDYQERRDLVAPSLFEIFYLKLTEAVLADDVGADRVGDVRNNIFFHQLAAQPDAPWWDDQTTTAVETREDILERALGEAITWLDDNVGGDMESWQWGTLHTATFSSDPLGQSGIGPVEGLVNRGPFPADGGRSIVNATGWSPDNPAIVTGHPSMRMIVDMSDFDASLSVIPTGQSGHPQSPHYDDEIEMWLNGEYHPMWWSDDAIEETAVNHLVLTP